MFVVWVVIFLSVCIIILDFGFDLILFESKGVRRKSVLIVIESVVFW